MQGDRLMPRSSDSSSALGRLGSALPHEIAGALARGWLDAAGQLVRVASTCSVETLEVGADLAQAMGRAAVEVQAALPSTDEARHLAALVARTGDLGRSTAFLWAESGLKAQERLTRLTRSAWGERPPAAAWLPRALLLAVVAADIYAGYASLRAREQRWSGLVRPTDWALQHDRGRGGENVTIMPWSTRRSDQTAEIVPIQQPASHRPGVGQRTCRRHCHDRFIVSRLRHEPC
jgi:hypothetical protein